MRIPAGARGKATGSPGGRGLEQVGAANPLRGNVDRLLCGFDSAYCISKG